MVAQKLQTDVPKTESPAVNCVR